MNKPPQSRPRTHPCHRRGRARGGRVGLVLLLAFGPGATAIGAQPPRLFTTAEQRAHLDRVRHEEPVEPQPEKEPAQAATPPEPPPPVHLRGFVRRSGGPEAVWVNGDSTLGDAGLGEGMRVDGGRIDGNDVLIRLRDGRTVRLKPGQTWDPERGVVQDVVGH